MSSRLVEALLSKIASSPDRRPSVSGMDKVAAVLSEATTGDAALDHIAARVAALESRQAHRDQQPRRPPTPLDLAWKEAEKELSESRDRRQQPAHRAVPESCPTRRSASGSQTLSLTEAIAARPDAISPAMLPNELERQREAQRAGKLDDYLAERRRLVGF